VRDHAERFERAQRLIWREAQTGTPVLISHLVLDETKWVLRSPYKLSKGEILDAFSDLMSAVDVNFEDEPALEEVPFVWKNSSMQFADCLIGARYGTLACSAAATFDADSVKLRGSSPRE